MVLQGIVLLASARGLYLARHLPTLYSDHDFQVSDHPLAAADTLHEISFSAQFGNITEEVEIILRSIFIAKYLAGMLTNKI